MTEAVPEKVIEKVCDHWFSLTFSLPKVVIFKIQQNFQVLICVMLKYKANSIT